LAGYEFLPSRFPEHLLMDIQEMTDVLDLERAKQLIDERIAWLNG